MVSVCERWFAKNTFQHGEFSDIGLLVRRKEEKGLSLSVCMPTLNVESTVGEIVRVLREELMERHPLIDQIAIVDSRSSDRTVEIASSEGAEVYYDDEILPEVEPASGKGEALWKSLAVLTGDIVAWVDSDIKNIHPRFVYGIVGPLFSNDGVSYVKGFYERPITVGMVSASTGGGRVTELVARPVLSLFYPELSGLLQPLSGEYAGRRSVLESVPFFTGYGVETGLLIDIYNKFGLECLAQVNLDVRRHHNQSLEALSRMSFGVLQVVFQRLDSDGKIKLKQKLVTFYNAIRHEGGEYSVEPVEIEVIERPPIKTVPGYRDVPGGK